MIRILVAFIVAVIAYFLVGMVAAAPWPILAALIAGVLCYLYFVPVDRRPL